MRQDELFWRWAKPLGEVANSIDLNVLEAEMAKKQINEAGSDIASLQENLKFEGYDIEYVALEYPRTVCDSFWLYQMYQDW